jgi:ubiquitin-protein ligase
MNSPRLRRLKLDYDRLITRFQNWRPIKISGVAGQPPEHYQVTFYVKGLYTNPEGKILERHEHIAEFNLSLDYPRRAPQCKMLTPVFHPNFDESSICIGDFWAASEGLDDLIVRIGRMITFQEFNTKSPLNGLAAKWASEHASLLPVDPIELAPPLALPETNQQPKIVVIMNKEAPLARPTLAVEKTVELAPRLGFGTISVSLGDHPTTIGRHADNVIQLNHHSVSGHHAVVLKLGDNFLTRDLGSTNRTRVNGSTISEAILREGDQITFGDVVATFLG